MVNRVIAGAHYGLRSWLVQRFSALAMILFTLVVAVALLVQPPHDYASWKALFSMGWMRAASLIFIVSLLLHAWVGMRDVLMDYAKPTPVKVALEFIVIMALVVCAGWAAQILWRP